MKKILMGTKSATDMTSFLRAWGAFSRPEMRSHCDLIRQPEDPRWIQDWTYFRQVDCVYLHRPYNVVDAEIISRCLDYGIPLWVDLDDDLESITPDNPVYPLYGKEECQQVIRLAIKHATILTVGGASHEARLKSQYAREVIRIPNMVDDYLIDHFAKVPANRKGKERRISWRGSASHEIDLIYYGEVLKEELRKEGEWRFYGLNPYHLGGWCTHDYSYSWVPPTRDLFDFYRQFTQWNADLQFVGLLESEFNRVKSNLAWSDGTLAGSLVIAPFLPEYDRPGVIHYSPGDLDSLREAFARARFYTAPGSDPGSEWGKSMSYINEHLRASVVNQKRIEILRERL